MDKTETQQIAIMDKVHNTINVITISEDILQSYQNIEEYIQKHCGFVIDNISWMVNDRITINANLSDDSFNEDETIQKRKDWLDISLLNFSKAVDLLGIAPWFKVVNSFHSRDEILVTNKNIFGDEQEHGLDMLFYDGFAIQVICDEVTTPLFMIYPKSSNVWDNKILSTEIMDFCSSDNITPFEVALKYGELYTYSGIKKLLLKEQQDLDKN